MVWQIVASHDHELAPLYGCGRLVATTEDVQIGNDAARCESNSH